MFRNLNSFCVQSIKMNHTTWFSKLRLGKGLSTEPSAVDTSRIICGLESSPKAHLPCLTPDPFPLVCWKSKGPRFLAVYLPATPPPPFEWNISLLFPWAPAGLHSVLWGQAGTASTWAARRPARGLFWEGFSRFCWRFGSLTVFIFLHVDHWRGGGAGHDGVL